jgi:hypothetical protein
VNAKTIFDNRLETDAWPPDDGIARCEGVISGAPGETYLVFRDREGRLLGPTLKYRIDGIEATVRGPSYVRISGLQDPWYLSVLAASKAADHNR